MERVCLEALPARAFIRPAVRWHRVNDAGDGAGNEPTVSGVLTCAKLYQDLERAELCIPSDPSA